MTLWAKKYRKYPHERPLITPVKMKPHPIYDNNLCIDVYCQDCDEVLTFEGKTNTAYCTNPNCNNEDVLRLVDDKKSAIRIADMQ